MKSKNNSGWLILTVAALVFLMISCSLTSTPSSPQIESPTPTPTSIPVIQVSPIPSQCHGLSGALEMQVQVGPAEAVGLEPFAVGEIPFSVEPQGDAYIVVGGGAISYQDVLAADWGTYTVSLDMDNTLEGTCEGTDGNEVLKITIEMSGNQMVEVRAEGFEGDYPWEGTHTRDLSFPLANGATAEGEGWAFILHLNQ